MEPSSPQPDSRTRRLVRYLRIAFSVTCGIACVLLIVLGVRSYSAFDRIGLNLSDSKTLVLVSHTGHFSAVVIPYYSSVNNGGWDCGPIQPSDPIFADSIWPAQMVAGFGRMSNQPYHYCPNYPAPARYKKLNLRERSWTTNATGLIFPQWALLLPVVCLGAIVLRGGSFPLRFSLRTLLLATTVVAVVLGLFVGLG